MKKRFLQVFFILSFLFLGYSVTSAATEYDAPLSFDLSTLYYKENWAGEQCLAGTNSIYELVNSSKVPLTTLPKITLESTDGSVKQWVYVENKGNNSYYFDVVVDNLDYSKTYVFKIKSGNSDNTHDSQIFTINDDFIPILNKNIYSTINNNLLTISHTYSIPLNFSSSNLYYKENWASEKCLAGNSNIYQIVNGTNAPLTKPPKITLESTDGSVSKWVYVENKSNNNYYFDVVTDDLDFSKDYVFKIKSGDANNTYGYQTFTVSDNFIPVFNKNIYATIQNNTLNLSHSYSAKLSFSTSNLYYRENWAKEQCLACNTTIYQIVNGTNTPLTKLPKMSLESTDGSVSRWVYVENKGNNNYYFDVVTDDLDFSKDYVFKIKSGDANNTYDYQTFTVSDNFIPVFNKNIYATIQNNTLNLANTYSSELNFSTSNLYFRKNWAGDYCLAGDLSILESISGINYTLSKLPKITLESTDGSVSKWVYVENKGNNNYYFDVVIDGLDSPKNYVLKIKSGNSANNNTTEKIITLSNKSIIIYEKNLFFNILNNVIKFSNTYEALLNVSNSNLYCKTNWNNEQCLAGSISIYEVINGTNSKPNKLPKMTLESTDGSVKKWVYVEDKGNNYYFDVVLDNIDFSKQYIFKVQSGNENNVAPVVTLNIANSQLNIGKKYIKTSSNLITISDKYSGNINFDSGNLYFIQNWAGEHCIAGNIYIYEQNDDNTIFSPFNLPTITLIADGANISKTAYVEKKGNLYYFDIVLDDLNLNYQYYINIKDTNTNNISTSKSKNLYINSLDNNSYKYYATVSYDFIRFKQILVSGTYGMSGLKHIGNSRGTDLRYYKIGNGPNVLFAVFELHGYEDLWSGDGYELTIIAEDFAKKLAASHDTQLFDKWTVYVFPQANPDGLNHGFTNNGPGRCTITGVNGHGVDLNRCWDSNFVPTYTNRNYTGATPFGAYEAIHLRDFMLSHKSNSGQTVVIDLHGWTTQLIGDYGICLDYYGPQFYSSSSEALNKYTSSYGKGYLISWAKNVLGARSALIELPSADISNHQSVLNAGYSQKYYNATVNMLKGL